MVLGSQDQGGDLGGYADSGIEATPIIEYDDTQDFNEGGNTANQPLYQGARLTPRRPGLRRHHLHSKHWPVQSAMATRFIWDGDDGLGGQRRRRRRSVTQTSVNNSNTLLWIIDAHPGRRHHIMAASRRSLIN